MAILAITSIMSINIVLAHDSFTQLGGAEKVMDAIHDVFPDAPVYTTVLDKKYTDTYHGWDIRTSWLQNIYNLYPNFKQLLPLIPWAVSSISVRENAGVLLSSSAAFIKGIKKPNHSVHINYCHTPTRFLWSDRNYVTQEVPFLLRPFAKLFLGWMIKWDSRAAKRVDYFIANSKEVQTRIKKYYNRDSVVIYPGIDTNFWHPVQFSPLSIGGVPASGGGGGIKKDYFLIAGRLQPHKQNDLIIEVFNDLNIPLHVVGSGRQLDYLKSLAKPNITFLGRVSNEVLREEYTGARGLLYPQLEDFGLMPLEAAGCGTATIALGQGGSLETVIPGITGELFNPGDKEKIKQEIKQIILNWDPEKYKINTLRQHAENFSKEKFKQEILKIVVPHTGGQ
jgi:glycosyltransferase involved in cell wall biosynthesis